MRRRWKRTGLLRVDPSSRRSEFDRLKAPAKAASIGKFKLRLAHLAALDALGPTEAWLEGVPPGKISHFAGEARVTDVADFNRIGEDKRLTLLASLIHVLRTSARDEVTEMFCKRMAVIHKKGRARLEALREEHRVESERLLEVFGEVLAAAREASEPSEDAAGPTAGDDDVAARPDAAPGDAAGADEAGRDADAETARRTGLLVLKALAEGGGVERLSAAHEAVAAHHGNNYLPLLEAYYKSHRPVLFTLVDAIELEATSAELAVLDALEFVRANRDRRGDWIEESTVHDRDGRKVTVAVDIDAFAGPLWRRTLRDRRRPGMLARRHLEVCVFSHLAAELRSGDIAVVGSDSYANLHAQLMGWEQCEPLVEGFCAQAGIPAAAEALVAHYRALLTRTAAAVDTGYPANTDLRLEGGKPVLARRKGADRRPSALALEAAILDRLPERHLLDVLARTAYLTGWPRHFGPASGSDPKIRDSLGRYVVTAFAYGGNLGPTEVARHMRGVSAHEIYTAGNKHADPDKIYKASADVVNAFAKLDVAAMWGDGPTAAVDGEGGPHDHATAVPVRAAAARADHRDHQPHRGVPQVLRPPDDRRAAHRPQRPRLPGTGRKVQRADIELRHLLHRPGHHRRGERPGRRGPRGGHRRPGHDQPVRHPHHPPLRRLGPRPRPTGRRTFHPAGPRTPGAVPHGAGLREIIISRRSRHHGLDGGRGIAPNTDTFFWPAQTHAGCGL